jgi:signal peptidase I
MKFKEFIIETVEVVLIALFVVLPIRYFLIQPFVVRGSSMEPTFNNNDYLIVDELSYRLRNPERGEVIVFRSPVAPNTYYIKRIIGLPSETVEIKDNKVYIYSPSLKKEFELKEKYLNPDVLTNGHLKIELGPDEYFVLGDNRRLSYDSRSWGAVRRNEIVGRVLVRLYPFLKIETFKQPNYEGI